MKIRTKKDRRERIRLRQRKRIHGTAERPRLAVFRSVAHIYAQVIDDMAGRTVASAASTEPALKTVFSGTVRGGNLRGRRGDRPGHRRAAEGKGHHPRRVRPRRQSVSRPRAGGGRRGPQSRAGVLRTNDAWLHSREKIDASELELKDTVVTISRVTKVVKGGKNLSFSALVVIGDGHGVVGFGIGKAKEVPSAIKKAIEAAKKALVRVPMAGTTIPHPVLGRFGAGSVLLKPAPDGTGIIAGGAVRAVVESAGINNVLTKSLGSANPHNVVRATFAALETAARSGGRGAAARQGTRGSDGRRRDAR